MNIVLTMFVILRYRRLPMKTRLTLKPGQEGTKRLVKKYGDALVCIRFRYDEKTGKRFKTVELIVDATDWTPPPSQYASEDIVPLRILASEMRLRTMVKAALPPLSKSERGCSVSAR